MRILLVLAALIASIVLDATPAPQGGLGNPNCEDGFDATVPGPEVCNCTSSDLSWDPVHWETYQGPSGRGDILDELGNPVGGTITGGATGFSGTYSPSVTVPAGKCIQVVYDFFCCPVQAGTNCSGTGTLTFVETDADCD